MHQPAVLKASALPPEDAPVDCNTGWLIVTVKSGVLLCRSICLTVNCQSRSGVGVAACKVTAASE